MLILEACTGSLEEAKKAEALGADRIELCDNLLEGGTTPSFGVIALAKQKIKIPLNVIIRPRGGNFVFTGDEFGAMKLDIEKCKELGGNGVVVGLLDQNDRIPQEKLKELLALAYPLSTTFHMAFDEIADQKEAVDILAGLGVHRILTKGGKNSALENLDRLKDLIAYAGEKIIILPGGGITKENREMAARETAARELHGTKIVGALK